jgi:hypothetical protein
VVLELVVLELETAMVVLVLFQHLQMLVLVELLHQQQ